MTLSPEEIRLVKMAPAIGDDLELTELAWDVAEMFRVSVGDILSLSRERKPTDARQMFYYLARRRGFSYPSIARFAKRDTSTVMHGASVAAQIVGAK